MRGFALGVLRVLGYVWSAPYGLFSCLVLLLLIGFSHVPVWRRKVGSVSTLWWKGAFIVFAEGPFPDWMSASKPTAPNGWGAFTLGWVVLLWSREAITTLPHEYVHVDQCLILGVFMPLVYGAALPVAGYRNHPLERWARAWAERPSYQARATWGLR